MLVFRFTLLLLAVVISFLRGEGAFFLCSWIVALMQSIIIANLLPTFLDTDSVQSYECKSCCIFINFIILWSFYFAFLLYPFLEWSRLSYKWLTRYWWPWWDFCNRASFWGVFSFFWDTLFFLFLFHFSLFVCLFVCLFVWLVGF